MNPLSNFAEALVGPAKSAIARLNKAGIVPDESLQLVTNVYAHNMEVEDAVKDAFPDLKTPAQALFNRHMGKVGENIFDSIFLSYDEEYEDETPINESDIVRISLDQFAAVKAGTMTLEEAINNADEVAVAASTGVKRTYIKRSDEERTALKAEKALNIAARQALSIKNGKGRLTDEISQKVNEWKDKNREKFIRDFAKKETTKTNGK